MDATSADQTPEIVMGHCNCFKTIQLNKKKKSPHWKCFIIFPLGRTDRRPRLEAAATVFIISLIFFLLLFRLYILLKAFFLSLFFCVSIYWRRSITGSRRDINRGNHFSIELRFPPSASIRLPFQGEDTDPKKNDKSRGDEWL